MTQFIKNLPSSGKIVSKRWLLLKLFLSIGVLGYLYTALYRDGKGITFGESLQEVWSWQNAGMILLLVALVPVNWALESWKWQRLAAKATPVSYRDAVRSTLAGLLAGLVLPAQVGEVLGRVGALRSSERIKTVGAVLVSGGIQFYVSLAAGAIGFWALRNKLTMPRGVFDAVYVGLLLLVAAGVAAYGFRKQLANISSSGVWLQKFRHSLLVVSQYTTKELLTASGIGLLRYGVYTLQFVLALRLFEFPLPVSDLVACVAVLLLAKTVLPTLTVFGDLGIRGLTALYVFGQFDMSAGKVVAVSVWVWVLNIVIPVLIGLVILWGYKRRIHAA